MSLFCLKMFHTHLPCKGSLGTCKPLAAEVLVRAGLEVRVMPLAVPSADRHAAAAAPLLSLGD